MYTFNIPARKYVYPALFLLFLLFMLLRQVHAADRVTGASPTRTSSEVVNSMNQARSEMNNATQNAIQNAQERIGASSTGVQNASAAKLDDMEDAVRRQESNLRNQYRSQAEYIDGWHSERENAYDDDDRFNEDFDWEKYDGRGYGRSTRTGASMNNDMRMPRTGVVVGNDARRQNDIRRTSAAEARNDSRYMTERAKLDDKRNKEIREFAAQRREIQQDLTNSTRGSSEYTRLQNKLVDLEKKYTERQVEFEKEYRNIDASYSLPRW